MIRVSHAVALALVAGLAGPAMADEVINFGVQPSTQPILVAHGAGFLKPIEEKFNVKIVLALVLLRRAGKSGARLGRDPNRIGRHGSGHRRGGAVAGEADRDRHSRSDRDPGAERLQDKDVAQLKGAKIAYPGEGSQQYPLLIKALADAKLTVKDVQLFKTQGSQVATLLANKSVDAGITWDPHVSRALADGVGTVLMSSAQIMPIKDGHYVGDGTYAREDFIKSHPALVQALINAEVMAIDLILKDPEKAIDIWTAENQFPARGDRICREAEDLRVLPQHRAGQVDRRRL